MRHLVRSCRIFHPWSLRISVAPRSRQPGMVSSLCDEAVPGSSVCLCVAAGPPAACRAWAPGMSAPDSVPGRCPRTLVSPFLGQGASFQGARSRESRNDLPSASRPRTLLWVVAEDRAQKSSCPLGNLPSCWRSRCGSPQPQSRRAQDGTCWNNNGPSLDANLPPAGPPPCFSSLHRNVPFRVQGAG